MGFNWKVFFVALSFSLAIGVFSNIFIYLVRLDLGTELYLWVTLSIDVVHFFVSPLVLFASFYLIGRNIDLIAEFPSILVPLFLGSWIGHLIGYFSLVLLCFFLYAETWTFTSWNYWHIFWFVVFRALSLEFFVGFGALSMSYIVKKRQM